MSEHRCSVCGDDHVAIKHHPRDEVRAAIDARARRLSVTIDPDDPDLVRRELRRTVGSLLDASHDQEGDTP